jgi:hypothetical protein
MLDRVCARVLMAGGAALATAVANCACVLICGLLPVVLLLLRSCAMHHFWRRSCVTDVVGTLVDWQLVLELVHWLALLSMHWLFGVCYMAPIWFHLSLYLIIAFALILVLPHM